MVQDGPALDRLLPALAVGDAAASTALRFVVLLWGEPSPEAAAALGPHLHTYAAVLAAGAEQVGRWGAMWRGTCVPQCGSAPLSRHPANDCRQKIYCSTDNKLI